MKRIAEEKRREKLSDELAKKRVLDRIREDREEKQKKYSAEKDEADRAKEALQAERELVRQRERMAEEANKGKIARVQFRLTDGGSVVNQFDPEQTLEDAKAFIANVILGFGFNLSGIIS